MITNDEILEAAAEGARRELNKRGEFLENFFSRLKSLLDMQELMANPFRLSWNLDKSNMLIGAAEFETFAANSVIITDMFNEGIDKFFDNPENAPLFDGMDKEQLSERRRALKDFAAEKLELHPETEQGRQFVQAVKTEFDNAVTATGDKRAAERLNFMKEFTAPLHAALEAVSGMEAKTVEDMLAAAENNLDSRVKAFSFNALKKDAQYLAGEHGIISHTIKDVFMSIDSDESVMPQEFLSHYKQGKATEQEIKWAADIFDAQLANGGEVDFARIMHGKKPLFNYQELNNGFDYQKHLKYEVLGAALSGEDISILKDDGMMELISPKIVDARKEHMSFIDRIINFFKGMLGIGKEKENAFKQEIGGMQKNIDAVRERFENSVTVNPPQPISRNELMGISAVNKTVISAKRQNTPEKEAPSLGK